MIEFTAVESDLDLEKFIWTLSGFYSSLQHEWNFTRQRARAAVGRFLQRLQVAAVSGI